MIRTYSDLIKLQTYDARFEYLKLNGKVSDITFGNNRYLNQEFYKSDIWLAVRNDIIIRDLGCDLGLEGYEIYKSIMVHHMNPITMDDLLYNISYVIDHEYLICTSPNTHRAIHYGQHSPNINIERRAGDTCPWK